MARQRTRAVSSKGAGKKRAESMRAVLKEHPIARRWSTINGAIQIALAVPEVYDEKKVAELIELLDQKMDDILTCVYCGDDAATWDHLLNNIQGGRFSGYGNRILNLVPACRTCNERKGGKPWRDFVKEVAPTNVEDVIRRLAAVEARNDVERHSWEMIQTRYPDLASSYDRAQGELRAKVQELDKIAEQIRAAIRRDLAKGSAG